MPRSGQRAGSPQGSPRSQGRHPQQAPRDAARRQGRLAPDAFDPTANLQGGRAIRTSNRPGTRPQAQYGFDIADAFQLGKYILAGIVALLVVAFIAHTVFMMSPATYTVNGQQVELARNSTYRGLVDSGTLDVHKGNLVAVDGEVLEEGKGLDPTAYLDGQEVGLDERISDAGDITAKDGEDEIEPYTATQEITPFETKIARDKEAEAEGAQVGEFNFYNGVLHVVTNPGQEGIVETRTGETTGKTATVKVQDVEPRLFENLHPVLSADNKLVALTFDDGPSEDSSETPGVLSVLSKYNVKATFFMLGSEAEKYPQMAKQVADAGHQVCSHSYSHAAEHFLNSTTPEDVRTQVRSAREAISAATGIDPMYIRPPGGNVDVKAIMVADELADGYIGWSVDPHDYDLPGANVIAQNILDQVEPGSIVLLHDGGGDRSQTIAAIDEVIPKLQAQGYTFVTIDELVAAVLAERGHAAPAADADAAAAAGAGATADAGA